MENSNSSHPYHIELWQILQIAISMEWQNVAEVEQC